ncbi:hypothetical protein Vretimale_10643, partial [Volvox reticuliferus]
LSRNLPQNASAQVPSISSKHSGTTGSSLPKIAPASARVAARAATAAASDFVAALLSSVPFLPDSLPLAMTTLLLVFALGVLTGRGLAKKRDDKTRKYEISGDSHEISLHERKFQKQQHGHQQHQQPQWEPQEEKLQLSHINAATVAPPGRAINQAKDLPEIGVSDVRVTQMEEKQG